MGLLCKKNCVPRRSVYYNECCHDCLSIPFRLGTPYKEGKVAKDGRYREMTEALIDQMGKIILFMRVLRYTKYEYYI